MSTLKTTNLQESNASGVNIVLGTGSGGGATISGVTTATTLRATTGIVTAFSGDITIDDKIVHAGDTNTSIRFPSADTITAETAGSERIRIDSTGWMGAGLTSRDHAGQVAAFKNTSNANSWLSVNVNNNTGIGGIVFGDSDNWAASYIQVNHSDNSLQVYHNGGEKLRVLSGGGLTFNGDTATANALDDYEEGTWTPSYQGTSTAGSTTHTTQNGFYTRVGNMITLWFYVVWTGQSGSAGTACLSGIPVVGATGTYSAGSMMWNNIDIDSGRPDVVAHQSGNASVIYFYSSGDNNAWVGMPVDTAGAVLGSISYRV